jgi:hypothetical protein
VLATIGMTRLIFFSGQTTVRRWEIVIPVLGIIVLGYTVFRNIYPFPTTASGWWGPGVAAGWLVIGLLYAIFRASAATRAGQMLTQAEGLSTGPEAQPAELAAEPAS